VRLEYDPDIHALYLMLDTAPPAYAEDIRPGVLAHYDATGRLVGLELLDLQDPSWGDEPLEIPAQVAGA
jgi:uncharacterized protein YuzE